MRREGRSVLDLRLDDAWLSPLARNVPDAVHQMRKRGTLRTLQRGRYLVATDSDTQPPRPRLDDLDPVADAVLRRLDMDYYVSWHSALWHYGLIDQQSRRIYVAVTKRKRPVTLGLASIRFVTVAERKFFGRTRVKDFEWPVWMATVEKTFIDCFDQPRITAPLPVIADALCNAHRSGVLDPERLVTDALRFGSPNLNRRLGFFMDLYDIPGADPLALHVGRTYAVPLAPGGEPDDEHFPVNKRWRVYEDPAIIGTALELK
ncbi:MAG: type IV toxin-antitoxin system AbiEi family antitoxin domain-containing protein [Solirubrobacteraceae bacterium]